MKANVHPLDIVFSQKTTASYCLMAVPYGSGLSVRISFANLEDLVYDDIGRAVRAIARGYRQAYIAATGKTGEAGGARKAKPAPAKAK
jgi:aspartate 4-decarboxylase